MMPSVTTRRRVTIVSVMLATIFLAGCDEVTRWDARGSWSGNFTLPGGAGMSSEGTVDAGEEGPSEARLRMCDLHEVTFGLPFTAAVRGEPAAIRVRTAEALCRTGGRAVQGGSVLVWTPVGQDTLTVRAVPSDEWVVSGEVEILSYDESGLPDLDVGESATTEIVSGTFALTAVDSAGNTIVLEEGTFELVITATRVEISFS